MTTTKTRGAVTAITFISELREPADIWILPQTEQILKTTLWGKATIAKIEPGKECQLMLGDLGGPGTYILRAIDTDEMYYEANDIALAAGYTLHLADKHPHPAATLDITDANDALVETHDVFFAAL